MYYAKMSVRLSLELIFLRNVPPSIAFISVEFQVGHSYITLQTAHFPKLSRFYEINSYNQFSVKITKFFIMKLSDFFLPSCLLHIQFRIEFLKLFSSYNYISFQQIILLQPLCEKLWVLAPGKVTRQFSKLSVGFYFLINFLRM